MTALAAISHFGVESRFHTLFSLTSEGSLWVQGRGDPSLISEEWKLIAKALRKDGLKRVKDILLDDSYYDPSIDIPGRSGTENSYDADVCALSTNFNTISIRVLKRGVVASGEEQTPLTPLARELGRKHRRPGSFRICLRGNRQQCLRYSGEVLQAMLEKEGVHVDGNLKTVFKRPVKSRLILDYQNSRTLAEVLRGMLEFSSNFSANQVLLNLGAAASGPPATLEKGVAALRALLRDKLQLSGFQIDEGSGLSVNNRISARQMGAVLQEFKPYAELLPEKFNARVKTGTLSTVRSLAGYASAKSGAPFSFVIFLDGTSRSREKILELLIDNLQVQQ